MGKRRYDGISFGGNFFEHLNENPLGVVMRDSSLGEYLIKDVELPKFYEQIGTYLGMEFTQASVFIERAHYSKNDQFVCLIDGSATVKLVPHIYWNEMYLGE